MPSFCEVAGFRLPLTAVNYIALEMPVAGRAWTIMAIKAVCSLTTGVPGCVVRLGGDESAKRSLTTDGSGSSYSCGASDGEHDAPRTGRVRPTRVVPVMESMMHDLHYTLRTLRKDSGFAAFAILIIALGIGASSTVS